MKQFLTFALLLALSIHILSAQTGNVGIGTTSPDMKLSVSGGMNVDQGSLNAASLSNNSLKFGLSISGEGISSNHGSSSAANYNGMDFYTNSVNRLAITNTGKVGIGTSSPQVGLHLVNNDGFVAQGTLGSGAAFPITGVGPRMFWYPKKAAFRAGGLDIYGAGGTEWNDANIGEYSVAVGENTTASGIVTTAMGYSTTASGSISTAMGYFTNARSHAETVIGSYNTNYTPIDPNGFSPTDRLFVIGNGRLGARSDAMTVLKSGAVGIGTSLPVEKLDIIGGIRAQGIRCRTGISGDHTNNQFNFNWTGSNLQAWIDGVNVGTVTLTSDRRLKENITPMAINALAKVMQLKPVSFKYKNIEGTPFTGSPMVQEGFIADELQQIVPSAVIGEKDALTKEGKIQPQTLNIAPVVSVLTKAIQEQQTQIEQLKAENKAMKAEMLGINDMKSRLNKLESALSSLSEKSTAATLKTEK